MAVQFSTDVRNALLDSIETAMGTSVKVQFYTGAKPANCAAAASGTKLAEFALGADWASAASAGSKAFSGVPLSTTALANGICEHYRIVDSAGTTCHEQGTLTVSGGGGDMTIDNAVLASGQAVQITGWTKTAPGV